MNENKIEGLFWHAYAEYDGTLSERTQVDLAKSVLDADSRTFSAIILGVSIVAGAWILGSKLKRKEEED